MLDREVGIIFDVMDTQYDLDHICSRCGSDRIELLGCHYTCLHCGNQEGCGD